MHLAQPSVTWYKCMIFDAFLYPLTQGGRNRKRLVAHLKTWSWWWGLCAQHPPASLWWTPHLHVVHPSEHPHAEWSPQSSHCAAAQKHNPNKHLIITHTLTNLYRFKSNTQYVGHFSLSSVGWFYCAPKPAGCDLLGLWWCHASRLCYWSYVFLQLGTFSSSPLGWRLWQSPHPPVASQREDLVLLLQRSSTQTGSSQTDLEVQKYTTFYYC